MDTMVEIIEENGVMVPRFKEITASEITDDTVFCTLQDLIDLLGEERAIDLYARFKTAGE